MRYMMLIYTKETERGKQSAGEVERLQATHWALMDEARRLGIFRAADPLKPVATATTVRVQNGKPLFTDGPFAETKEQLAGYYILECKDLDEALAWAAKIPVCGGGAGCVEVRPLAEFHERENVEYARTVNG